MRSAADTAAAPTGFVLRSSYVALPVTPEISSLRHVNGEIVDYAIGDDSRAAGRIVKDLALPEGAVIAMIARREQIVPPQGNT